MKGRDLWGKGLEWLAGEAGGHILFNQILSGVFSKGGEAVAQGAVKGAMKVMTQEDLTEAIILRKVMMYLAQDENDIKSFLQTWQQRAVVRLNEFRQRNPDYQDKDERLLAQRVWHALKDGIGMPQAAPAAQGRRGRQQAPPAKPAIDPLQWYALYLTVLGKEAIDADTAGSVLDGDQVFIDEMKRLEKISLGETTKKMVHKGSGVLADFLEGLFPPPGTPTP